METESALHYALGKLDDRYRDRFLAAKNVGRKADILGGGLLLQLGLQKSRAEKFLPQIFVPELQHIFLEDILEVLGDPIQVTYRYGVHGKPYFEGREEQFSISHSGEYIFCAFSDQEVGADIQKWIAVEEEKLLERFFHEEEKKQWKSLEIPEERRGFFFRSWARKEAYGKLLGNGVGEVIKKNLLENGEDLIWEDYCLPDGYDIAVCRRMIRE